MRESYLEKEIVKLVSAAGGRAYKFVSPGNAGVPDRICVFPSGRVIFIEVKRPGIKDGRNARQTRVCSYLESLGFSVWLISD